MTEHTLTHLTASTAQYNERTDTRDHVDKVRIWASARCACGNYSHAYIWIEKRTVTTIPDTVLDVLERVSRDALATHHLHVRTHTDA